MVTILSQFLASTGKNSFNELSLEEKSMYACVWYDLVGGHVSEILGFSNETLVLFNEYIGFSKEVPYASLKDEDRYTAEASFKKAYNMFEDLLSVHGSENWYEVDRRIFISILKGYWKEDSWFKCEVFRWTYETYSEFVSWISTVKNFNLDGECIKDFKELLHNFDTNR